MTGKAKNMRHRYIVHFPGGREGDSGVKDMAHPRFGNLGAKFSETSFPHFKTCFTQIGHCYIMYL